MYELVNKVLLAVWGIWRFRWTALVLAWLIAITGWVVVNKLDHKFYASARVYIDTNQVLEPLLVGLAIRPDVKQRAALIGNTLLSRPNLERLVEATDLNKVPQDDVTREHVINELYRNLSIRDSSGSRSVYTLSYTHTDAVISKQVVDALIAIFIESNRGEEEEDNLATRAFLDRRIAEYESRLSASEKRLSDFQRQNAGSMPGESGGYYQRIDNAESQLRTAGLALREMQNRRTELNRQLDSEKPVLINRDPNWIDPDVRRIQTLQAELNGLLVRFTDRHPRVGQLRDAIDELQQGIAARDAAGAPDSLSPGIDELPSVVSQQLKTLLSETDARIAELQVRESYYQSELAELNATVDSIPLVEEQLVQLNRDYKTIQDQYLALLSRRETANLTEQVKKSTENVTFRVVDPAYVDSRPAVPNKKFLNLVVFTGATAVGLGLSLLLSMLLPVFFDKRGLVTGASLPMLGTVTLKRSFAARTGVLIGNMVYIGAAILLLVTLLVLLLLEIKNKTLMEVLTEHNVPLFSALVASDWYSSIVNSSIVEALTFVLEGLL